MILDFIKMSGTGNDFIIIDNRSKKISTSQYCLLAKKLCAPKISVGADGIIFVEKGKKLPLRMRYFNADGSEAAMCGNGARSFAYFVKLYGYKNKHMEFETGAGVISADLRKIPAEVLSGRPALVTVGLTRPHSQKLDFVLDVGGRGITASFIDTGVPHAVIFVDDLRHFPVAELGAAIRSHHYFAPAGTNVNFVKISSSHDIAIRTYERGVEGETLACGTGATASALIAALKGLVTPPVKVKVRSGEVLRIDYETDDTAAEPMIKNVYLTGEVRVTFSGKVKI